MAQTSELRKANSAEPGMADVAALIRRGYTTCVGTLASMTHEQFVDVIQTEGGKYSHPVTGPGRGTTLVVIGQQEWPLLRYGQTWDYLRKARARKRREQYSFTVLSERLFLEGLGLHEYAQSTHRLYTVATLTELLGVTRNQIRTWVRAGLIEPVRAEHGVWYFDFAQVSAAKSILEVLKHPYVTIPTLRRRLLRLKEWLPEMSQSLTQLAAVEKHGALLVRLADGDLASEDGQLQFDFERGADSETAPILRIASGPSTATEWHQQGIEQEQEGYLEEAVASYRDALLAGGSDAQIVFDLAHALHQQGRREEAAERYRQAVEMIPAFTDAWNNLGIVLCELDLPHEACEAFRRALAADPRSGMSHYNLADTLTDLGRADEAAPHWTAYLQTENIGERAAYARRQLA